MTGYDDKEASIDDGRPYFLYLFDNGVTRTRLTSNAVELDREVDPLIGLEPWTASPVSHGDLEQASNIEKNATDLTFPLSDTYARTLLLPVTAITVVTIWKGHHTDLSHTLKVQWKGRVVSPKSGKLSITVPVESIFTSMRRTGCRAPYQRPCRHVLYFPGCTLNFDDWKIPATVTDISGLELTVAEAALRPDGDYKAGLVFFNGLYAWVESHVGDKLTLVGALQEGLADTVDDDGSAEVEIAPGCDLSKGLGGCKKFGNNINHGGFEMPDVNPFTNSIV
ncbi:MULTISPECIES: phage BR0599 family protein [unclassified Mesorhizobium]|uniref:phage BR0599 family protein n=1 Tax=unclassified Mesorhizobium TaxID=325217 RepID=UPI000FCC11FB|nr:MULTISPECIES: phage BR0599 family protein [unclassified Mesorhizobium]RUX86925.1 DUF2163 domain-containing protein [Mesorhizobium sp. M7D.F.Ca.US.004.01.2.1]RVA34869.1 DUF2163 domain-containing protein [Mesorhizobium sp. M7D.F.Ca.US.004.03.1.1]